jgi:hypothetical protein
MNADASFIESQDDDGPPMPYSTFANQYGQEAKPGKLSGMERSSENPVNIGTDGECADLSAFGRTF